VDVQIFFKKTWLEATPPHHTGGKAMQSMQQDSV
jgi:hypothetical protein